MEIFMSVLLLLAGVGAFLIGMKQMSSGLEQSAGVGLRRLFKRISDNKFAGYGVGIGATAIVQSSSATSVMTVGLANAGIVNERQGSAIILGAKVGTTLTAFVIAMSGLSKGGFSVGILFSTCAFIGILMNMITKKDSIKKFALFLTGFGLIFLALEIMEVAMSWSGDDLQNALKNIFQFEAMQNPLLLLLVGIAFTFIIQSSSAATGIFIGFLMLKQPLLTIDQSFFLVMGANIGTCSDGLMAAIGASVAGKRIAIFHLMTSVIGALMFMGVVWIFKTPIVNMFNGLFSKPEWSLATFNLGYNLIYTVLLLLLLSPIVKLTELIVKDKPVSKTRVLKFLDDRLLQTPALAYAQIKKEVLHMAELTQTNLAVSVTALIENSASEADVVRERENTINQLNQEIADFLIKCSAVTQNAQEESIIGATHHVINDIERIADHAQNFMGLATTISKMEVGFSEDSLDELKQMYAKVHEIFDLGIKVYDKRDRSRLPEISVLENEIDAMNKDFSKRHISRLHGEICEVEVQYYYDIISELERISDHVVNIAYSIQNPTGKQNLRRIKPPVSQKKKEERKKKNIQ